MFIYKKVSDILYINLKDITDEDFCEYEKVLDELYEKKKNLKYYLI